MNKKIIFSIIMSGLLIGQSSINAFAMETDKDVKESNKVAGEEKGDKTEEVVENQLNKAEGKVDLDNQAEENQINEAISEDDFDFDVDTGTLYGYKGNAKNLVIPELIKGLKLEK